jgi:hypothetical protein
MTRDGYTSVEALAALLIIGLTTAGLATAIALLANQQRRVESILLTFSRERSLTVGLAQAIQPYGPFRSDHAGSLAGSADRLEFRCGAETCGARLEEGRVLIRSHGGAVRRVPLPNGAKPRFRYIGSGGSSAFWPPSPQPPPAPAWQVLRAIAVDDGQGEWARALAIVPVWNQQAPDCEYDLVIQDCRSSAS